MLELGLLLLLQAPATALASTSADSSGAGDPLFLDEEWVRRAAGSAGTLYLNQQAQMALLGDLDGDGVFDAPSDVDALCWWPRPGATIPAAFDVAFSLLAGIGSYEDGDLLRLHEGGGVEVVFSEAQFVAALQPVAGGFDLDAAELMPPNEIWFSTEGGLTGTVLGDLEDGDVLVIDRVTGFVRRAYSEAQMQAFAEHALGTSQSIGDVLSLAFDYGSGELLFTVQSPSAHDATVFSTGAGGSLYPGWSEPDWAFAQETELDALSLLPMPLPPAPTLATDSATYAPGTPVPFTVRHGTPGAVLETYVARSTGHLAQAGEGVGFFFLNRSDATLRRQVAHGNTRPVVFDAAGEARLTWTAPSPKAGSAFLDLYFQSYDLGAGAWTAPIVLRMQ